MIFTISLRAHDWNQKILEKQDICVGSPTADYPIGPGAVSASLLTGRGISDPNFLYPRRAPLNLTAIRPYSGSSLQLAHLRKQG